MSYTNATFYLDYEGGSDSARADLVPTAYANNGAGLVRITCNSTAAYSTGAVMTVAGTSSSLYVGSWIVTIVDGTHVDLQGSAFTSNPATKGTLIPRGGSSKTDAWKTLTSGATAARTAAGDIVRIMGSPGPTSMAQNGTWTEAGPNNTTYAIVSSTNATPIVITLSSGNYTSLAPAVGDTIIVNAHTTNTKANGVWKISAVNGSTTITLVNADGTNSVGNGIGGATGTVRKINNCAVILASAVTQAIAVVGNQGVKANWTASANVVDTVITSDFKEGGECQQIAIGASFATGLAAYFATGTLNLSGYQQVSFWVKQTAGTVAVAGDASIRLCTDTIGAASVHTAAIPAMGALNQWIPVTVDLATNLNTAIASVALYVDTDRGAQTFLVDCITACKASSSADSLTLTSLIGKNTGTESWNTIQSINGVRVMLDGTTNSIPASNPQRGYTGTTETVTAYKRETIKTTVAGVSTTIVQQFNQSGAVGNLINYEGGWDRTNMTTQNLETWFDGQNGFGVGLNSDTVSYQSVNKLNSVRYSFGLRYNAAVTFNQLNNYSGNSNTTYGWYVNLATCTDNLAITVNALNNNGSNGLSWSAARGNTVTTLHKANGNIAVGVFFGGGCSNTIGGIDNVDNNGSAAIQFGGLNPPSSCDNVCGPIASASYNGTYGLIFNSSGGVGLSTRNRVASIIANNNTNAIYLSQYAVDNFVGGGSSSGNSGSCVIIDPQGTQSGNVIRNFTVGEATPVSSSQFTANLNSRVTFENYGGVAGDHRIFTDGGSFTAGAIVQQTAVKHGSDNFGWKYSPTSANRNSWYPLERQGIKLKVAANKLVTITRWVQRDNTGLTIKLVCPGGQLNGVPNDVTATISAAINTWEQLTITFTPTEAGVIAIYEQAYGGTTFNGYTSDFGRSQAS